MLDGNLTESGGEFPNNTARKARLQEVHQRDWYVEVSRNHWFQENFAVREGGTFPDITLCIRTLLFVFHCGKQWIENSEWGRGRDHSWVGNN